MLSKRSSALEKAVAELKRLSQDEETQRIYEAREKVIRDENSRTKTAIRTVKMEIAYKMLRHGTPMQYIIEDTGLSEIDIEKIRTTL